MIRLLTVGLLLPKKAQNAIFSDNAKKTLEELAYVKWNKYDRHLTDDEACVLLKDCSVAVGSWKTAMPTKKILDCCTGIKLWEHAAGSVKKFFTDDLKGRNIRIASCAPAIAKTVAEMVLGEIIVGLRRIIPNAQGNSREIRAIPDNKLYLSAATVGIIGASQVGRHLINLLEPFNTNILVYDPYLSHNEAEKSGVNKVESLLELCSNSDVVTIHTPKTKETYHMVAKKEFKAMKDDTVFINTSRGTCIDEEALINELQKGRLFAFLDVSDPEPARMNNPIRILPNAIYTSHLAGGASYHIGDQVVSDLTAFMNGRNLEMEVSWKMLDRLA